MRVDCLHRYPVKSMLGEQLEQAVVGERGVLGDRGYAVVDLEDGTVASAKHPRKWGALLGLSARYAAEPVAGQPLPAVVVTFPDGSEHDSHDAADIDAALSGLLGRGVRLTSEVIAGSRFEEQWPAIEGLAPERFVTDTTTSYEGAEPVSALEIGMLAPPGTFFDLAVLHLLTTSTLQMLTDLAPGPVFDARRYRPNIVVDDAPDGFAEDAWVGQAVGLGDQVRVEVSMLAMRCVMTTLAQQGLAEDRDTLRAIARHHRREIPGLGTWACAGVYAGVGAAGTVRVGDPVALPG
ncbi:MAG: MOSC domain-containing protein [Frankiales bacterium]|nr:MOSC domain-containing protein [Frankiales bacterium]